jgi:hypothetical protein
MYNEKEFIDQCCEQIENKLGWGPGSQWQNQDFEALSARILAETKVSLSASTLKRVWGKVRHEGAPTLATLNALARFAGHENWHAFMSIGCNPPASHTASENKNLFPRSIIKAGSGMVVIAVALTLFWFAPKQAKQLTFENVTFSSRPVTNTIPNTVVFSYDVKDSNADSVFIQQSWDPNRKFKVDKNRTEFTSTYYLPGYYRAKLILDDSIVAEQDIFVESNGWLATINWEPIPVYFSEEKILRDGILRIDDDLVTEQGIDLEKENLSTTFFRVSKQHVVSDSAFQLNVTLKNSFGQGAFVCKKTQIMLMGPMGVIFIPLSIKGCVGEIDLMAGSFYDGNTTDLSSFGVDFSDWVTVQCHVQNRKISIWVNEKLAFEGDYKTSIGPIVGTRIDFMGLGEVKEFTLK